MSTFPTFNFPLRLTVQGLRMGVFALAVICIGALSFFVNASVAEAVSTSAWVSPSGTKYPGDSYGIYASVYNDRSTPLSVTNHWYYSVNGGGWVYWTSSSGAVNPRSSNAWAQWSSAASAGTRIAFAVNSYWGGCPESNGTWNCAQSTTGFTVESRPTLSATASLTATSPVSYNSGTYLQWSSSNTSSCTLTGFGSVPTSNSGVGYYTGNLTSDKTYTLSCNPSSGATGNPSSTVTVRVNPPPPSVSASLSPSGDIYPGTSLSLQGSVSGTGYSGSNCFAFSINGGSRSCWLSPGSGTGNFSYNWTAGGADPNVTWTFYLCANSSSGPCSAAGSIRVVPLPTYSISASAGAGGSVSCSGCGTSVSQGASVSVTATPQSGYQFGSWTWSGRTVNPCASSGSSCSFSSAETGALVANFSLSPPSQPSVTSVTGSCGGNINLSYGGGSGAASFRLLRNSGSGFSETANATTLGGLPSSQSGLSSGSSYQYQLEARNSAGSVVSSVVSVVASERCFDYSLSNSGTLSVVRGQPGAVAVITITHLGGTSQPVYLSASGIPSGVRADFESNPLSGSGQRSNMWFVLPSTIPLGSYPITVSGSLLGKNTSFTLIISPPPTVETRSAIPVPAVSGDTLAVFASPGETNWSVPATVSKIRVKVWGSGGAGGTGRKVEEHNAGGSGGGGGGYAEGVLSVSVNATYKITVGKGGIAPSPSVTDRSAEQTEFSKDGTAIVGAGGGGNGFSGIGTFGLNGLSGKGPGGGRGGEKGAGGGGGSGYAGQVKLKGADGLFVIMRGDNADSTSGAMGAQGGSGGLAGRCGRNGRGSACTTSHTIIPGIRGSNAQDGFSPGGGGGGSSTAYEEGDSGGYGAGGRIVIEVIEYALEPILVKAQTHASCGGKILVTWTPSTDPRVAGYLLYRMRGDGTVEDAVIKFVGQSVATYTDTTPLTSTRYWYHLMPVASADLNAATASQKQSVAAVLLAQQSVSRGFTSSSVFTLTKSTDAANSAISSAICEGPTVTLTAPDKVLYGNTPQLTWSSQRADKCRFSHESSDRGTGGTLPGLKLYKPQTFTVTCTQTETGRPAVAEKTVNVYMEPTPAIFLFPMKGCLTTTPVPKVELSRSTTGAKGYTLERREGEAGPWEVQGEDLPPSVFPLLSTGLKFETKYFYRLTAENPELEPEPIKLTSDIVPLTIPWKCVDLNFWGLKKR